MSTDTGFSAVDWEAARKSTSYEDFLKNDKAARERSNQDSIDLNNLEREIDSKLLDLSTSNQDILDLAKEASNNPQAMIFFQTAMNMRTQIIESITNALKSMHDAARAIIANIRD